MNKKKIRGVAFDFEGPLFEFEKDGHHAAHRLAAADAGIELSHEEALELLPNLVGGPGILVAHQVCELMRARGMEPKLTPEEIFQRQRIHFGELFAQIKCGERRCEPRLGFPNALLTIRRQLGLKTMIGTSTHPSEFWTYFKKGGFDLLFQPEQVVVVDDNSAVRHKPHPDIFLETAARMGIEPSEQLVIEDSPRGVKAGVTAGSPVVGLTVYDCASSIIPVLQEGALRVFVDWREINFPALIENLNAL